MTPKYKFFIYENGNDTDQTEVFPNYKTDLAKEYELENNQKFYRVKLSGKISFLGKEFDYIVSRPLDTEFNILIKRSDDWGQTWVDEFLGRFFRTDCDPINYDDKILSVQPDPVDDYTEVLAGLDKEYNLIPLAPEIQQIILQKRPLIQVYIPGDNIVSCFLGGNYWEQDANATTDLEKLVNDYYFALCNLLKEVNISSTSLPGANGLYTGRLSITTEGSNELFVGTLRSNSNSLYYIRIQQLRFGIWGFGTFLCELKRVSDDVTIYKYEASSGSGAAYDNLDFVMTGQNGATGTVNAEMATYRIYARYLLDVEKIQGLNTYELPNDDIVPFNRNYRRAIGYAIDIAYISQNFSDTPTEWGRADNLKYYQPPGSIFGDVFYPIARSTWRYASIWFSFNPIDNIAEISGRKRYVLRDSYPVHSVINQLLKQFAPNVTHTPTTDCSQFFYGEQNPISWQKFMLYVTQKSNILNGSYTQPAQKAPATLGQFLNMLRDTFKCYWHIENGKLRIEHVSWYNNGGTYSGSAIVGIDLTAIKNPRNKKDWAFNTSSIKYDKVDMPERFQFNWMDDSTTAFEGLPIEVKSKFVTPGKIEDVSVSNFTSDVDLMILNPEDMSKDGFALFAAVDTNALVSPDDTFSSSSGTDGISSPRYEVKSEVGGFQGIARFTVYPTGTAGVTMLFFNGDTQIGSIYIGGFTTTQSVIWTINTIPVNTTHIAFNVSGTASFQFYSLNVSAVKELPFVQRDINGVTYFLQNGYLAFVLLQPNFWVYDLPAYNVEINGAPAMVFGVEKKKKQDVSFPIMGNPDLMKLIKTHIGNGTIEKMSVNLHSRNAKTTLKYDTE